ncbi:ESX secretion-associated protein EspG [Saccharomonospora sp. NPDC046836]|uniref:ESX secretion-associated protein EspG n=1 Tax=Saccharomonospora sp. NPDC046836 TaxID=3156921 RepID=UPI0033CC3505
MRDDASGWISLHPGELYLIWTELGLGALPTVLDIPHVGRTAAARAELVELADRALGDRDLGTVARPAADLAAMLHALASPQLLLDLQVTGPGVSFRAVGAAGPHGAVTAGVADGDVRIGPVHTQALVATMLDATSPLPAGVGSPGNVRLADYRRACRAGEYEGAAGFVETLRGAGVRPAEANTFARAVSGRVGGGQLGAGSRERGRASSTVNWVDTEDGRYTLRQHGDWVTVTPVDPGRLRSMAEEMLGDLT